ncbi:MAG TPA: CocE/NonD family hydrolase [Ilumatobacteraceae bacterium]|nr:CocE/NonD family hydrolase [Ilumatobacteraceae bacterium]
MNETDISIAMADGVRLAATLYLPDGDGPFAALLEALPYRKDDLTASYRDSYVRFADKAGFAVCRLDLRGTGSSGGTATDEYPDVERTDLRTVIEWLATQEWSSGRVGMFGTSYSGFNSLHMAAEGVPELGAVVAMYATDDRYTDDVHYHGGVLRGIDLIDYVHYMVPMNALPPVPALWGDGWDDEWRRRVDETPAWVLDWLREQADSAMWRRGSIRLGPGAAGYERLTCPTMLVAGWADGYRNNTFRTIEQLRVPWRLLAGPWSHKDPARARPGPNIDADAEIIAFFDEHLRDGPPSTDVPAQVFVRRPTHPEPDLVTHDGIWRDLAAWPPAELRWVEYTPVTGDDVDPIDELAVRGDVGVAAWISCAGGLPWGQPLDQRPDDARSMTYDWPITEQAEVLGSASLSLRVRSSVPVAHLAVRLCDVFPDGTSALITRGILNLSHIGCWPVDPAGDVGRTPSPVTPDAWVDARVELEATTWTLVPGHTLRLAIAGSDWPNCWPPPASSTLGVDRSSLVLRVPHVDGLTESTHVFLPGDGPPADEADGVVWEVAHDVLGRETRVRTRYGGHYEGCHGSTIDDVYEGELGVSTVDPGQAWARGRTVFTIAWPEATCSTVGTIDVQSNAETVHISLHVTALRDGTVLATRAWHETFPRTF